VSVWECSGTVKCACRDAGRMVQTVWNELPVHYLGVDIDAFAVMPNHIHGIIVLDGVDRVGAGPRACPNVACPNDGQPRGLPLRRYRCLM